MNKFGFYKNILSFRTIIVFSISLNASEQAFSVHERVTLIDEELAECKVLQFQNEECKDIDEKRERICFLPYSVRATDFEEMQKVLRSIKGHEKSGELYSPTLTMGQLFKLMETANQVECAKVLDVLTPIAVTKLNGSYRSYKTNKEGYDCLLNPDLRRLVSRNLNARSPSVEEVLAQYLIKRSKRVAASGFGCCSTYSSDGNKLVIGSDQGDLTISDLSSNYIRNFPKRLGSHVKNVCFCAKDRMVAEGFWEKTNVSTSMVEGVRLRDVNTGLDKRMLHLGRTYAIESCEPNIDAMAVLCDDIEQNGRRLELYDIESGTRNNVPRATESARNFVFNKQRGQLACNFHSEDIAGKVLLWDPRSSDCAVLDDATANGGVGSLDISSDGMYLAGDLNKRVTVWDIRIPNSPVYQMTRDYTEHEMPRDYSDIYQLKFIPNQMALMISANQCSPWQTTDILKMYQLIIWDLREQYKTSLRMPLANSLAVSPSGTEFSVPSIDSPDVVRLNFEHISRMKTFLELRSCDEQLFMQDIYTQRNAGVNREYDYEEKEILKKWDSAANKIMRE